MTQAQPVALWQQLQAVAQALVLIRKGTSGTAALDAVAPALRPGVQALLFHVLRQLGRGASFARPVGEPHACAFGRCFIVFCFGLGLG